GIFADRIHHHIDIFADVFEFLLGVIDRHVGPELLEQILIWRRCRREHFRAARLRDLNGETSHAARAAVNQDSLTRAQFRCIEEACQAVSAASGTAAASSNVSDFGFGETSLSYATAYSA